MSVIRQESWLGEQRVDVPHLRAIDSGVAGDFDVLAGQIIAGHLAQVVAGFAIIPVSVGTPTSSLQLSVLGGTLLFPTAGENGTIFNVPSTRTLEALNLSNPKVQGSFTSSSVNYISLDLRRSPDSTTADLVQFLDPDTDTEQPEEVPLARTLDYIIIVSPQSFSATPGLLPLAKVTTDSNNAVASVTYNAVVYPAIEDARNIFGRLGKGGSTTQPLYTYNWPGGRKEVGNNSDFAAGDKAIANLKTWMDATMTRLWEVGGGEHWYSNTLDHNVAMTRGSTGTPFTNGEWFEWSGTNLHWKSIVFRFDNSTGYTNEVADQTIDASGLTNLADGDCIYVDLDRSQNRTVSGSNPLLAQKGTLTTLGGATVPGARWIMAYRVGSQVFARDSTLPVGATFNPATKTSLGIVRLLSNAVTLGTPIVPTADTSNGLVVAQGISRSSSASDGGVGSGQLTIGGQANDASIVISKNNVTTTINGNTISQNPVTTSVVPVQQWMGADSLARTWKDHNGYEMGATSYFIEDWQETQGVTWPATSSSTNYPYLIGYKWKFGISTGTSTNGTVGQLLSSTGGIGAGTGRNFTALKLQGSDNTSTDGTATVMQSKNLIYSDSHDLEFVFETYAIIGGGYFTIGLIGGAGDATGGVGGTITGFFVGVSPSSTRAGAFIYVDSTGGGSIVTNDGLGATNSQPISVVAASVNKFRIEYYGSSSAYGNIVKFYLNGALLGSSTTALPHNVFLGINIESVTPHSIYPGSCSFGPIRCAWNHSMTPAIL